MFASYNYGSREREERRKMEERREIEKRRLLNEQKKEEGSLRKEYMIKYIDSSTTIDKSTKISDKIKNKSKLNKNINKIIKYTKKIKNCEDLKKGWFSKKKNTDAINTCRQKYNKKIKKQEYEALNKLYNYSKKKLSNYILKLNNSSDIKKTISSINKYTKILEDIYTKCKSSGSNPYNYKSLLNTIITHNDLKKFYELNNAYINFLYKDRGEEIPYGEVLNTINKLTNINEKFKDIINKISTSDTICSI